MARLFWIIVVLVLVLTGANVPVLFFGGWALVVVLAIVLLSMFVTRVFEVALLPFSAIWKAIVEDAAEWRRGPKYPSPGDSDFALYCEWVDGRGEYSDIKRWEDVKRRLEWEREHVQWRKSKRGMPPWEREHQRILSGGTPGPIPAPAVGTKGWLVFLATLLGRCS